MLHFFLFLFTSFFLFLFSLLLSFSLSISVFLSVPVYLSVSLSVFAPLSLILFFSPSIPSYLSSFSFFLTHLFCLSFYLTLLTLPLYFSLFISLSSSCNYKSTPPNHKTNILRFGGICYQH